MNPWGLLIIAIGILLVIVGVKGSQRNIADAITNKTGGANSNISSAPNTTVTTV